MAQEARFSKYPSADEAAMKTEAQELLGLADYTLVSDVCIASWMYQALRKSSPKDQPFSFLLGEIYFLGKIQGKREARRAKTKSRAHVHAPV